MSIDYTTNENLMSITYDYSNLFSLIKLLLVIIILYVVK